MSSSRFLPRRLSLPKIFDILVAYLNVGADKEYVGVSEVASKSSVTLHNISRNNGFLKSWGFIEESEKEPGKYRLTKEAAEFAYAYRIDPEGNLTKQLLRNILSKDETMTKFIERINRERLDRDSAILEIPRVAGDLRADKVGLTAFLDLIAYAFQISWLPIGLKPKGKIAAPKEAKAVKPRSIAKVGRMIARVGTPTLGANIALNLTISPEITPEKLKEYIKAILKAYDEYAQSRSE
ncbi:hypothetical protein KEJ34_07495 [Candidatus Bathyarchaeota archaeon]|nr:hypothetical protein [Candidatus Bathyarchaeota archaeon]